MPEFMACHVRDQVPVRAHAARARENNDNLIFVRDRLLLSEVDLAGLLELYRKLLKRKRIGDDESNPLISVLKLSGIVRVMENFLEIRNAIYSRVFDKDWISTNMPDAEKRRQQAAFKRGFIRATIGAGIIIALMCAGALFYFDGYVWEHETYYNTFIKRFGLPVGIGELTENKVNRRSVSYKFVSKGRYNPVSKVDAVRSTSKLKSEGAVYKKDANINEEMQEIRELTPLHEIGTYFKSPARSAMSECQWEFARDLNGDIVYEKAYDRFGNLVWGLIYSPKIKGQHVRAHYVGPNGFPRPQTSSAAEFVEFEYSDVGDETLVRYTDRNGFPQPGLNGVYGKQQRFDKQGLIIESTFLGRTGTFVNNIAGTAITVSTYDNDGNKIQVERYNAEGKPSHENTGWHIKKLGYDGHGNLIEWACFGAEGKAAIDEDGYHKNTYEYDERGNRIEWACFDTEGKATLDKDGYHKITYGYDARGNQIERACFDAEGKATLDKDGYHKITWVWLFCDDLYEQIK